MSPSNPSLESLRREIDTIDTALHDLLMRRAQVVERVARAKAGAAAGARLGFFRPGREAAVIRRLAQRHQGAFPLAAVVRIWREIISAMTLIQGPFAAAVYAPGDDRRYWDLARGHFGSVAPFVPVNTAQGVLRALADGSAAVGVVPLPQEGDGDPWWRSLLSTDAKAPRVIASLPLVGPGGAAAGVEALVLACQPPESSGHDHAVLAVETTGDISRGRLKDLAEAAGLSVGWFRTANMGGGSFHLLEVLDAVGEGDPRLALLAEKAGDVPLRALPVGLYAAPLAT